MGKGVENDDALLLELLGPALDLHHAHVLLWQGFDLSAAGIEGEVADCPFCAAAGRHSDCTGLDADQVDGCWVKYVACGNCGTHGPWGSTESQAVARWNQARPTMVERVGQCT